MPLPRQKKHLRQMQNTMLQTRHETTSPQNHELLRPTPTTTPPKPSNTPHMGQTPKSPHLKQKLKNPQQISNTPQRAVSLLSFSSLNDDRALTDRKWRKYYSATIYFTKEKRKQM